MLISNNQRYSKPNTIVLAFFLLCLILIVPFLNKDRSLQLPFDVEEVVSIDAYYYLKNFTDSGRKKVITDPKHIQTLYTTLDNLEVCSGDTSANEYKQRFAYDISAYRFTLSDGSTYEIVCEGYDGKNGVMTSQDMAPCFISADIGSLWLSLTEDAVGCPEDELPVPYRENPVP